MFCASVKRDLFWCRGILLFPMLLRYVHLAFGDFQLGFWCSKMCWINCFRWISPFRMFMENVSQTCSFLDGIISVWVVIEGNACWAAIVCDVAGRSRVDAKPVATILTHWIFRLKQVSNRLSEWAVLRARKKKSEWKGWWRHRTCLEG